MEACETRRRLRVAGFTRARYHRELGGGLFASGIINLGWRREEEEGGGGGRGRGLARVSTRRGSPPPLYGGDNVTGGSQFTSFPNNLPRKIPPLLVIRPALPFPAETQLSSSSSSSSSPSSSPIFHAARFSTRIGHC